MKKGILVMLIAALILGCYSTEVLATSKKSLVKKVENLTEDSIKNVFYADYDGDGSKEAFIVTQEAEDKQTLWFASSKQVKKLETAVLVSNKKNGICRINSKQKLFVIEGSGNGSGSWSYCYYVKQGKAHMVKKASENLSHLSGKEFVIYPSEFDSNCDSNGNWTGHTWKAYYLYWTGTSFKQYVGKEISESKLGSYKNGSKYLKQIKKADYKIGKIFYRKNGIININVYKKNKRWNYTDYNNVTLSKKGKKVVLKIYDKKGKNIIEKSGFGGIYKSICTITKRG